MSWTNLEQGDFQRNRRNVPVAGPTVATCEVCSEELSYYVNSIVWAHQKRDLCPEHKADEIVDRLLHETIK